MKKHISIIVILSLLLVSCSAVKEQENSSISKDLKAAEWISVTDSIGRQVTVNKAPKKVVVLSSSMAEIWLLAGGKVTGVSSDAVEERDLGISKEEVEIVGTIKDPSAEKVLALKPDLVILLEDIDSHTKLVKVLEEAQIPAYVCKVETLEDYLSVLRNFALITGEETGYQINGEDVQKKVNKLLASLPASKEPVPKALVLRAYASGIKAKADDSVVCNILEEIGVDNIAANNNTILEDLSIEAIIKENPDYIFLVTMGSDDKKAMESLNKSLASNPAWNNLKAVQNGHMIVLPKELFHYKPNNRWGESYEYLLKIIYPEVYKAE